MEEKDDENQRQFFSDLGATAEQTVQEVRGFEENYYSMIHWAMPTLPWLPDLGQKLQNYVEENFAATYDFARELSQTKDMQDFVRIYTAYIQRCSQSFAAQMRDFAEIYAKVASGTIKASSLSIH